MRTASPSVRTSSRKIGRRSQVRLERVCAFLRERHPAKTADGVAAETGLGSATVRKWLEGKASPSGVAVVVLAAAYGPELLVAVMDHPPAWLTDAGRAEHDARIEAKIAELSSMLGRRG